MPDAGGTTERYVGPVRFLHWVVAIAVIATYPVGTAMLTEGLARSTEDLLLILHKNGGVLIFLLVVLRLGWRLRHPAPPFPAHMPIWQSRIAVAAHWALYALLLVMTVSGYVRVRAGGFPIEMLDALRIPTMIPRSDGMAETAKGIHATARLFLGALILVHVAAAMHHLWRRDRIFERIWPPIGRGNS